VVHLQLLEHQVLQVHQEQVVLRVRQGHQVQVVHLQLLEHQVQQVLQELQVLRVQVELQVRQEHLVLQGLLVLMEYHLTYLNMMQKRLHSQETQETGL
jgi:hypothetical protein